MPNKFVIKLILIAGLQYLLGICEMKIKYQKINKHRYVSSNRLLNW